MSTPAPTGQPTITSSPEQIRSALRIYKVLAIIAGIALFVLIAAMFVHHGPPKNPAFSRIYSPIHGALYFAYAVAIANLGFKSAWPLTRIVANLLTGFVPVLPFIAEKRVAQDTEVLIARLEEERATRL